MVGIDRSTPDNAELGYWLGVEHWVRGFATEAARGAIDFFFEEFEDDHLYAGARVTNPASRNVLEKCGFQWSGVQLHRFLALGLVHAGRLLPPLARGVVVAEELEQRETDEVGRKRCWSTQLSSRRRPGPVGATVRNAKIPTPSLRKTSALWVMVWTAPYGIECARMRLSDTHSQEPSVSQIIRIGMDTSKYIFQLHGVDASEQVVLRKRLGRKAMLEFFAKLPPTVVVIEACGAAHVPGARAGQAGTHGQADRAAAGKALRGAQQERWARCRGAVRSRRAGRGCAMYR